jgi:hypothetical protein
MNDSLGNRYFNIIQKQIKDEEKDELMLKEIWRNWASYDRIDKLGEDE